MNKGEIAPYDCIQRICQYSPYHMNLLLAMMAETRDKYNGKGLVAATYMLAETWLQIDELRTIHTIFWICNHLGSFKDLKWWCFHLHNTDPVRYAYTIDYIVHKMNEQLYQDMCMVDPLDRSNIAKWIPREKSKYGGWLYNKLAVDWYNKTQINAFVTPMPNTLCKEYRKVLSKLHNEQEQEQTYYKVVYTLEELIDKTHDEIMYPCTTNHVNLEAEWQRHKEKKVGTRVAKNMLLFLLPSPNLAHFKKQVATVCQAMMYTGKRRIITLVQGSPVMTQFKSDDTWLHMVKHIWTFFKPDKEANDTEEMNLLFQESVQKMPSSLSSHAIQKMTWVWISDLNVLEPIHDTQFMPYWKTIMQDITMPHMIYCNTSDQLYSTGTRSFPCTTIVPRCTFVPALHNGLTRIQWCEIMDKTYDATLHNTTCWENVERVLQRYL